ncbi:hypothetical protein [Sphingomonas oryzagri]
MIGGQALNLWAEYYSAADELALYRPYTSKDIDYFGQTAAAEKLANALGGKVRFPDMDNATPQTAIVQATVGGQDIEIDFLGHVLGVRPKALLDNVVEIVVQVRSGTETGELAIPVMAPLHCLQSRLANLIVLGRPDDTAARQAEAAPIIVREYVSELLASGDHREATRTLQGLFAYLSRDPTGKRAHTRVNRDPLDVLRHFASDERIDARYRELILTPAIMRIESQRSAWGRILEALSLRRPAERMDPAEEADVDPTARSRQASSS